MMAMIDDPKKLTPEQIKAWNDYVSWLEKKGMAGSKELDKKDNGLKWLNTYIKENPSTPLKPEHIVLVQQETQKLAENARAFAARRNDPNAQNIMQGTSKFDGIPGSRTTSFKFPVMIEENYRNNNLVSSNNLGLVSGDFKPIESGMNRRKQKLPPNVKLEKLQDGYYYEDPQSGDMVKYEN